MKLHKDILYSVGDAVEIDSIKYTIKLAGWGKIQLHKQCCGDVSAVIEVDDVTAIRGLDIMTIKDKHKNELEDGNYWWRW